MARYVTEEEWEIKNMPEEVRTRIESRTALIETYNKQMKQSKGRVVPQFYPYEQWKKDHPDLKKKYAIEIPDRPLKSVQLVPVLEGDILSVRNYHPKPLKMIGYQLDSQKVWLTTGYDIAPNETLKFAYGRPKKVYARTSAGDTISSRVDRIAARSDSSEIIGDWRNYFIKEKQDWHWRVDVKNLDKRIELPTGNTFVMDSMEIEFLEHGLIICYGDLEINNSRLESHRRGNVGVRMFGSSLQIKNSTILGFSLSEKDGNSPFQVIGSKVFLLKTVFHDIEAEDAMNLVNCDVTIEDIGLYNCSSDGLDLDFCQGTISKAKLAYCWGDGIDVSYSNLTLSELEISNCGDKGVSVGERSNVKMNGVDISYCGFGIAVKDESIVDIEKSFIQECPTQLIAFRKKEFYKLGGTVYLNDMAIDTDVDEYSKIIYE